MTAASTATCTSLQAAEASAVLTTVALVVEAVSVVEEAAPVAAEETAAILTGDLAVSVEAVGAKTISADARQQW